MIWDALYNKAALYVYVSLDGQTTGPKGLIFFKGTHRYPWGNIG